MKKKQDMSAKLNQILDKKARSYLSKNEALLWEDYNS